MNKDKEDMNREKKLDKEKIKDKIEKSFYKEKSFEDCKSFETFEDLLDEIEREKMNENIFKKIYRFIYQCCYKIKVKYRDFIHFFKNYYRYGKILAEDRDWDFIYIFILLRKKFECILDYQEKYSIICKEENDKYKDQLKECIDILDRLIEDNYIFNYDKQKEDLNNLLKIINDNIFTWWD